MALIVPSWFKGRQGKAEPAGSDLVKLTGPNLREAYIGIRPADNGKFAAFLRATPDGPDVAAADAVAATAYDAWEAAFEIYRNHVVV
jgi:hypothetical protein